MTKLQIGGVRIDRQAALELGRHYLSQDQGWAYPAYDEFDTARANGPLNDSDLLAPVLLNVQHLSITTYQQLQDVRPRLQELLDQIPQNLSLLDTDDDLEILGDLFGVVDNNGIKGARARSSPRCFTASGQPSSRSTTLRWERSIRTVRKPPSRGRKTGHGERSLRYSQPPSEPTCSGSYRSGTKSPRSRPTRP